MVIIANYLNNSSEPLSGQEKIYQILDMDQIDFQIILSSKRTKGRYLLLEIRFSGEQDIEVPLHLHSRANLIVYVWREDSFLHGKDIIHA